jgi:(S)-ureidoglycine aminohydrolase
MLSAQTRTIVKPNHALIAPDGHVKAMLPGWTASQHVVLISPRMGAQFSEYFALMEAGGSSGLPKSNTQRFILVLDGEVTLTVGGQSKSLTEYGYAFIPANTDHQLTAMSASRLVVIEKPYEALANQPLPTVIVGNERAVASNPMLGDEAVQVRLLLPDHFGMDMAVNSMTFAPGAVLPFVETHVMEHGLLMLEGQGIYRLENDWYPVEAGDMIFMGPYCPQWFVAMGKREAKYLIYKDWNRDPL